MMKFFSLIIFFSFTSGAALAERLNTRVHSVDVSQKSGEPHLILFENGRVGFLEDSEKSSLNHLLLGKERNEWLEVELDRNGNYLGGSVIAPPEEISPEKIDHGLSPQSYVPTRLSSISEATGIFQRMRSRHQRASQCYNRAHVWAYEEFRRSGFKSMKLFLFFTRSYIRAYRYKWWFHVTPMTYVAGTPMTLDRTFTRSPLPVKTWTDKFIYSRRNCPVVSRYSQYRNHQETEHCYLIPASMYFWQPRDLDTYERTGFEKTDYIQREVDWAYREAF